MENNKKTLVLSILGVIVLIIAVVGVSFAMYTFSAAGTRENVITTGEVSIDYEDTFTDPEGGASGSGQLALTNQYPMSDALGIAQADSNVLTFKVGATISGTMTLKYEIGLDSITPGATLTGDYIKIVVYDETTSGYVIGSATEGVTIASLQNSGSEDSDNGIQSYRIASGTFTNTDTHKYTLKAWVSADYDLPKTTGGTGGEHTSSTTSETFTFKIKLVAKQAV